jgi:hypothetical protein
MIRTIAQTSVRPINTPITILVLRSGSPVVTAPIGFPAVSTTEGEREFVSDCDGSRTAFGPDVTDSTARIVDVEKRVVAPPEAGVTVNSVSANKTVRFYCDYLQEKLSKEKK